jgi:hypothetical protein
MDLIEGELNQLLATRKNENVIIDNNVLAIGVKNEHVYFATHTGVSRLDTKTMQFNHYVLDTENMSTAIGIGDSEFDTVWIGKAGGMSKIRGEDIEKLRGTSFENLFVYDSFTDKEGNVWFATSKNLHKFKVNDTWQRYRFEKDHIPTSHVTSIFIDSKDGMWLGSDVIYHIEGGKTIKYINWNIFAPADNIRMRVNDIEEMDGWVYFGTNRGIFRKEVISHRWEHFADENELPGNDVTSLAVTDNNTLWIGTEKGLVSYRDDVFFTYTTTNGLINNYVNTVVADGMAVWVGTKGGAARLKDDKWITVTREGTVDREFTLTKEQSEVKADIERQKQEAIDAEERRKEDALWATRGGNFLDLREKEEWAADYVFELFEDGIFKANDKFYPLRNVTREELAKMLSIAAGLNPDQHEDKLAPFIDVPEDHWANKYIYSIFDNGVLGKTKYFGLGDDMTRLKAIQWILKAYGVELEEYNNSKFSDVNEEDRKWVETADKYGIVKGYNTETSARVIAREIYQLPRFLQPGSAGKDVESLQKILQSTGFYPKHREITGYYDGTTTDAVADYQVARGILPKFTNGQFTPGLGAAGGETRSRMISEMVFTGSIDRVEWFFDPNGKLTRAQMAKVLSEARKTLGE